MMSSAVGHEREGLPGKTNPRCGKTARILAWAPGFIGRGTRGQIEISTTPFYHHPSLICDFRYCARGQSRDASSARAYRRPEDAREQLQLAASITKEFLARTAGLWPSEGSVSDQALTIARGRRFNVRTDEDPCRTLKSGISAPKCIPANADRLSNRGACKLAQSITDCPRSPLVGSCRFRLRRMDAQSAAPISTNRIAIR